MGQLPSRKKDEGAILPGDLVSSWQREVAAREPAKCMQWNLNLLYLGCASDQLENDMTKLNIYGVGAVCNPYRNAEKI